MVSRALLIIARSPCSSSLVPGLENIEVERKLSSKDKLTLTPISNFFVIMPHQNLVLPFE